MLKGSLQQSVIINVILNGTGQIFHHSQAILFDWKVLFICKCQVVVSLPGKSCTSACL